MGSPIGAPGFGGAAPFDPAAGYSPGATPALFGPAPGGGPGFSGPAPFNPAAGYSPNTTPNLYSPMGGAPGFNGPAPFNPAAGYGSAPPGYSAAPGGGYLLSSQMPQTPQTPTAQPTDPFQGHTLTQYGFLTPDQIASYQKMGINPVQQSGYGQGYRPLAASGMDFSTLPGYLPGTGTGAGNLTFAGGGGYYGTPPVGYQNVPFGTSQSTVPTPNTYLNQWLQSALSQSGGALAAQGQGDVPGLQSAALDMLKTYYGAIGQVMPSDADLQKQIGPLQQWIAQNYGGGSTAPQAVTDPSAVQFQPSGYTPPQGPPQPGRTGLSAGMFTPTTSVGLPGVQSTGAQLPPSLYNSAAASNPFTTPTGSNPSNLGGGGAGAVPQNNNTLFSQPPSNSPFSGNFAPLPGGNLVSGSPFQTGLTPDQNLALIASGGGAGTPISALPEWQAMVAAMQRPEREAQANLAEQMNVSGGRFSTGFGTAMTDLLTEQKLQEQSLLGQLQMPAFMQAQQLQAQAGSQLGGQDFQSQMQQYMASLQAAQSLFGQGAGAAGALAGYGAQGAQSLFGGSLQGAQGLFGAENQAGLTQAQQMMQLLGLGTAAGQGLSSALQSNLGLGAQLGGQQYGLYQQQLNNLYQQWMMQQPWANPLLPYMMSAASGTPMLQYPQYVPSQAGGLFGGLGGLLGGLGGLFGGLSAGGAAGGAAAGGAGGLLSFLPFLSFLSDKRVKTDLVPHETDLGRALGLPSYDFSYLWEPQVRRTGFLAQDVRARYPEAVREVPLVVDYGKLAEIAMLQGVN